LQASDKCGVKSLTMVGSALIARISCGTYSPSGFFVYQRSLLNSQMSTPNSLSTSRLRCATAGAIKYCSIGLSCASTIELPLKAPTGSVIASGAIRKPMPIVGRLETMVKPIPAACSPRTAFFAPSVRVLSLVSSVPSTSETTSAMRLMKALSIG
jgi:hypothetical protein